jgi:hypothetical protein
VQKEWAWEGVSFTHLYKTDEEDEGVYDDLLDSGINYLDVEEKGLVDEHALEHMTNAGLILLLES